MSKCNFFGTVLPGQKLIVRGVSLRFDRDSARCFNGFLEAWRRQGIRPASTVKVILKRQDDGKEIEEERWRVYKALCLQQRGKRSISYWTCWVWLWARNLI